MRHCRDAKLFDIRHRGTVITVYM